MERVACITSFLWVVACMILSSFGIFDFLSWTSVCLPNTCNDRRIFLWLPPGFMGAAFDNTLLPGYLFIVVYRALISDKCLLVSSLY